MARGLDPQPAPCRHSGRRAAQTHSLGEAPAAPAAHPPRGPSASGAETPVSASALSGSDARPDSERFGDWILTYTGRRFWPLDPRSDEVDIEDIAVGLANQVRFRGQIPPKRFYSVAQHSVIVSFFVPPELALTGLLHDASEAYLGDMSGPIKRFLPEFVAAEHRCEAAVAERFGLDRLTSVAIKEVDSRILTDEAAVLFAPAVLARARECGWALKSPLGFNLEPLRPDLACSMFLNRFAELTGCDVTEALARLVNGAAALIG